MKHAGSSKLLRFVLAAALLFVLVGLAPASAFAEGNQAPAVTVSANVVYVVRAGDTLAKIAARYGVTVQALMAANPSIRNPNRIYIGQRIVIPGTSSTPGGKIYTTVNIYLIGMGTGSVGCGDQAVPVQRNVPATAAPLTAALNALLSLHDQYYGQSGLYNALYQSHLSVQNITRNGSTWYIYLRGTTQLGGVCDVPRVEAQLMRTALQFSTVKTAYYYINGVPLKTALSLK